MANKTIPQLTAGTPPYDPATLLELAVPDGLGGYNSRKGELSDLSGLVLLTRGTIASPVAYLDLALPAGYAPFQFQAIGWAISNNDNIAGAFSFDDGVTFLCDTVNLDSYSSNQGIPTAVDQFLASLLSLSLSGQYFMFNFLLDPGSPTNSSLLMSDALNVVSGAVAQRDGYTNMLNVDAVIPPVLARATTLRLSPYGNGDIDPPTSGETITAGSYFLWGVPTP